MHFPADLIQRQKILAITLAHLYFHQKITKIQISTRSNADEFLSAALNILQQPIQRKEAPGDCALSFDSLRGSLFQSYHSLNRILFEEKRGKTLWNIRASRSE